jgi:hypothetical protein
MSTMGRPTDYQPEFCELARNYCLLGATNAELAGFFDVAPRTVDNWIAGIPAFADAVREGRIVADGRVAHSLYTRAIGFSHTVERTVLHRGEERKIKNNVHYPGDTQACIFWLRNRRRQSWRDRGEIPDDDGVDLLAVLDAAGERVARARRKEGD